MKSRYLCTTHLQNTKSSECRKRPLRPRSEPFTLDIVPGGKRERTTKAKTPKVPGSRAPHDLVAALRAIVDESDIGGISPDQVAILGHKWLMDRRHIKGLTARTL